MICPLYITKGKYRRSPGGGDGNLLQYSCLENSTDRGVWQIAVHGVTKRQTQLSDWAHTRVRSPSETEYTPKEDSHLPCNNKKSYGVCFFKEPTTGCTDIITHGLMQTRNAAREQYKLCLDFQRITMVARIIIFLNG